MKKQILSMISILLIMISMTVVSGDNADMTVTVGAADPTVDDVTVNDASPTIGTTTEITVVAVITDTNGVDDISTVSAAFTVGSPDNGNTITISKAGNCVDDDDDTITCTATYDMQFYDPAQTYTIQVTAVDANAGTDSNTDTFAYSSLIALELDATAIIFGSLAIDGTGTVSGDTSMGTPAAPTIQNQGNVIIDAQIYATDFIGDGTDSFGAGEAQSQFGTLGYTALSNDPGRDENGLNLAAEASSLKNLDMKLTIPSGALPETYTSTVTVAAIADA